MAGAATVVRVLAGPGGSALDPLGSAPLMASLTADEKREFREYERLLRFRDEVVNGSHPRIKPAHLPGKATQGQNNSSARATTSPAVRVPTQPAAGKAAANNARPVIDSLQSHLANQQQHGQVNMASSLPGLEGSGRPQINPVLLEKSDDLIKAEIQLQRQRVERSLREQLEQRRGAGKAAEQIPELDVADVLAKAMSLVHATPAAQPTTDDTGANASASSDSFDDNTFYSSRHDTPESNMAARLPSESEDEEMRDGSPYEPELDFEPVAQSQQLPPTALPPQAAAPVVAPPRPQQNSAAVPAQATSVVGVAVPGLHIGASRSTMMYEPRAAETVGAVQSTGESRTDESSQTESAQLSSVHNFAWVNERLLEQAVAREPPVVCAHDLSPVAPQPTHAVPPVVAGEPRLASGDLRGGGQAAPAQVTALRKQGSNGSSPESSPQGSRGTEKKKNKKKKRKADRLAAEPAPASPYIKPEPRSPSPLTPQYARPTKRQRYSQQQPLVIPDDEPRYEPRMPVEEGYQERYRPRVVRQERVVGYERASDYSPRRGEETILVTSPRYERVYYDDYRAPPQSSYPTGPEPIQYVSREVRPMRPASRVVENPYEEGATYYRDVPAASRMSVRPPAYPEHSPSPVGYGRPAAAMPPPPSRRIIVDDFGREYLEPARPATVVREEVAAEPRDPYERALPPRALSRRPEPLDDGAAIYRTTSPAYAAPRRVVTQPEYSYRDGGRPASILPAPPSEYLPSRPEASVPRDYIARSASVRPAMEPSRYDPALLAYERMPALSHDERLPRDYYRAATARPTEPAAARYEAPITYERRHVASDDQHSHHPQHEPLPPSAREYPPPPAPLRSASVRPAADPTPAAARYEVPSEYNGPGRRVEYAAVATPPAYLSHHQQQQHHYYGHEEGRRDEAGAMAPPPQGGERYYGRGPPLAGPAAGPDDEVVFVDRREGGYREVR